MDFPSGPEVENPPASAGDMGSIPGLGRSHMPRGPHATTAAGEATATGSPPNAARGAPTGCNWRKPTHSNEDPVGSQR